MEKSGNVGDSNKYPSKERSKVRSQKCIEYILTTHMRILWISLAICVGNAMHGRPANFNMTTKAVASG
jgi:hypothetical protein